MTDRLETARPEPCLACPWRTTNRGKRHPDGWYTKTNLRRLWAGMRDGEAMSCHPTDPNNPVSDRAAALGYRPAPDGASVRECTGALILQQRELMILQDIGDLASYRKQRPRGLTRRGIAALIERMLFGGVLGTRAMPKPNLNQPAIGYEPLPWTPRPAP